ncbi:MAG: CDP-alcohol phosphatidyltransferase family protein, partial [Candidatus Nanopelagicales bacterium]
PAIDRLARILADWGLGANQMTVIGFGIGIGAAALIATGHFMAAAVAILLSRLCDGLDGAIARRTHTTDAGGFLDIALDFIFYAAIPLAFALADPARNALPAALLLAAFCGTMSSFLAFAVIAAKRQMDNLSWPEKSFSLPGWPDRGHRDSGVFCRDVHLAAALPDTGQRLCGDVRHHHRHPRLVGLARVFLTAGQSITGAWTTC